MVDFQFLGIVTVVAAMSVAGVGPVRAANPVPGSQTCAQELTVLSGQWNDIGLPSPTKPAQARVAGTGGHVHTGGEVTFMREQFNRAAHLCKDGNEHEAMLRMDIVRAILNLSEVQHPAAHNYAPPSR